jgi:hypothetical protein
VHNIISTTLVIFNTLVFIGLLFIVITALILNHSKIR